MSAAFAAAALALLAVSATTAQVTRVPPSYSAATIVNSASNDPNTLAPYTIIQINGANLAWEPYAMQPSDIRGSTVPTSLLNTGVHVFISNEAAGIVSVSPNQITALIPGDLIAGPAYLQTVLDGLAGPRVLINLSQFGPGILTNPDGTPMIARPDTTPVTGDNPLQPGDTMVFQAVGLGPADPPLLGLEIPSNVLTLDGGTTVLVYLNGSPVDPGYVTAVSLVSGQAGMYQLTVQLPPNTPANPTLQISANGVVSAPGLTIPVQVPGS
jgi:uncharacterized protein (TIGR03437 family)